MKLQCKEDLEGFKRRLTQYKRARVDAARREGKDPMHISDCATITWAQMGVCTKKCGGGTAKFVRRKISDASPDGAQCGEMELERTCNRFQCPTHCEVSDWAGWDPCNKPCGGGVQLRHRNVTTAPKGSRGMKCPILAETQQCNVGACETNCALAPWTDWGKCTRACGGGHQMRFRNISTPAKDGGICPEVKDRTEWRECNARECPAGGAASDFTCGEKLDIVFLVDVSGSLPAEDVGKVKKLLGDSLAWFSLSTATVQMAVAASASETKVLTELTGDEDEVKRAVDNIPAPGGTTHWGNAYSTARSMLAKGRPDAASVVVMITDGSPNRRFVPSKAADALKEQGVRLGVIAHGDLRYLKFRLQPFTSDPEDDNLITMADLGAMNGKGLMASFCSEPVGLPAPGSSTSLR